MPPPQEDPADSLDEVLQSKARIEELPSDDGDAEYEDVDDSFASGLSTQPQPPPQNLAPWLHPEVYNLFPSPLESPTTQSRHKTLEECLPLLQGHDPDHPSLNAHGLPHLRKAQHIHFLTQALGALPAAYMAADASRPWIFYWCLHGLATLGADVAPYRPRLIATMRPLQNRAGGFGGGHGQLSHVAGTYACVLALATVGALDAIDRAAMWDFLGAMKQPDGGFTTSYGAEEDIRGAYCSLTILTLLNLPLDLPPSAPARAAGVTTFTAGLGAWIARCQTFEGGIAGAPTNEAHGAYAFCALACLSILDAPHVAIPRYLDVHALLTWLAAAQTVPEGGFAGRANKLVDACYSHWVGGCWALLEAAVAGPKAEDGSTTAPAPLWNRAAGLRYLLTCCQQPGKKGGMRDKPSVRPDAYHTCYSLCGVGAAEHHYVYDDAASGTAAAKSANEKPTVAAKGEGLGRLQAAFNWRAQPATAAERAEWGFEAGVDEVGFVHPVFVLGFEAVERARLEFEAGGF